MLFANSFSATLKYEVCNLNHIPALPPKTLAILIAILGDIAALQFITLDKVGRVTLSNSAAFKTVKLLALMTSSLKISPGIEYATTPVYCLQNLPASGQRKELGYP